ncbi:GntR family transcriptional regulator [Enterococcus sp. BWB1-3]|uniref:GntR family transcriptional regulator n=1 Tax=unclassified Enterococcus TaxID=2608891 RepID=UPI001923CD05|nr:MULTISPECIES: GntR family transcriptional regulator [unclassified Enterococcus]MBL1229696.1 GntR family transcriptional regulator [Enterococcus sp. BWB1-3]MCB5952832.1 GntR family transcriptional regulator [Enterococcus sp. BWT-B8]MCB5953837.1 GntR family transcriptional regulator [Enterococcus sp. CWB-B31]
MQRKHPLDIKMLVKEMVNEIQKGTLADESGKLPSEYTLMSHYNVSRYALRQALGQLGDMGYIYQSHGIGSFVRPKRRDTVMNLQNDTELTEELARPGRVITTVAACQCIVSAADADFLPENHDLPAGERLIEIKRQRTLDGEPYLIEQSYYLQSVAEEIPEESLYDSVFKYFELKKNIKVGFIDKIISSEPLSDWGASFFQLPAGAPTLVVRDDSFLSSGKLLAFSKICYDYRKAELFMFKKNY